MRKKRGNRMNKQQIKEVMKIVRPSLRALTGEQGFKLVKYSMVKIMQSHLPGFSEYSGWFQCQANRSRKMYKVNIWKNKVEALGEGELNL